MPRRATGQVIEPKDGRAWAIRFRAYGKRRFVTLGTTADGWDRQRAEAELRHVLADVERGIWKLDQPAPVEAPAEVPAFHEFASEWLAAKRPELRPNSAADYEWAIRVHLLPHFRRFRLSEITIEEVDRYRRSEGSRSEPVGRDGEQDADATRADPRGGRRVRLHRPQPGLRSTPPAEGRPGPSDLRRLRDPDPGAARKSSRLARRDEARPLVGSPGPGR